MFLNVLVDHARHRGAQTGQMCAAIALRNIVGKAEDLLIECIVPLHRYVDRDRRVLFRHPLTRRLKNIRMEHAFALVDVFNKTAGTAFESKALFLASTLIRQTNMHTIVEE